MFGYNWMEDPDERTFWRRVFLWFPKECDLSKRSMWLCYAYEGTRMVTGPGEPVFLNWWHHPKEHFIWKLKGN